MLTDVISLVLDFGLLLGLALDGQHLAGDVDLHVVGLEARAGPP